MSNSPLVSVVIPTYNSIDSLCLAIESVINQTYKNIELIIVDDGSTDLTFEIFNLYSDQNIGVGNKTKVNYGYYRLSPNSGSPVFPRNYGVEKASGEYIAFLDADDTWKPNKIETQIMFMQMTGCVMSYHDMIVKGYKQQYNWSEMSTCHSGYVFECLLRKNFIPTSSVMMKKKVYTFFRGMKKKYKISHDLDLWLNISYFNNIEYVNELLGILNLHSGSVITSTHRRRKETRQIIRHRGKIVNKSYYRKILLYYYLIEVFDLMPKFIKTIIRKLWYRRKKYNG